MPAHPKYNGLCLNHGTIHKRATMREDDLYNELASPSGAFLSQAEINQALGKLFEALAANRIFAEAGGDAGVYRVSAAASVCGVEGGNAADGIAGR